MTPQRTLTAVALAAYMATIPAANWMISNVGTEAFPGGPHTIPVGFGFAAPSGVLLIGVGLAARDAVQRLAGWRATFAAIAVGVILSWFVNPTISVASAAAFGFGELADLAVFSPLARKSRKIETTTYMSGRRASRRYTDYRWLAAAVVASGVVGGAIDTLVFLRIAFGSFDFWQGQIIGKTLVALAAGALILGARLAVPHRLHP